MLKYFIVATGELIAQGEVRTNTIQPLEPGKDLSVILNSVQDPNQIPKQVRNDKLSIKNQNNNEVASIDASGSAQFNNVNPISVSQLQQQVTVILNLTG